MIKLAVGLSRGIWQPTTLVVKTGKSYNAQVSMIVSVIMILVSLYWFPVHIKVALLVFVSGLDK